MRVVAEVQLLTKACATLDGVFSAQLSRLTPVNCMMRVLSLRNRIMLTAGDSRSCVFHHRRDWVAEKSARPTSNGRAPTLLTTWETCISCRRMGCFNGATASSALRTPYTTVIDA